VSSFQEPKQNKKMKERRIRGYRIRNPDPSPIMVHGATKQIREELTIISY
jgi:hypothetical protein